MLDTVKLTVLGLIIFAAAIASDWGHDLAYQVHALIIMLAAGLLFISRLRRAGDPASAVPTGYMDDVVRAGVIATAFWGVVGFLAGVFIAFQLAFPALNFDWGQPFTNFGRLRPLHTSAVIFAFGGNALIMSSFYIA
ncbi:MAG: cbb3-type cytochrome c oxidase subunit I, partial [Pseudomonadota bacterium]